MCNTAKCHACRPAKTSSKLGLILLRTFDAAAVAVWWLLRRVVGPGLLLAGWAAWVWLSGRTWRHRVTRRLVRREVRAAGNWLATGAVLGFIVAPVITAVVFATAGVGLLAAASTIRVRERLAIERGGPIRVKAIVGTARRLTRTDGGR